MTGTRAGSALQEDGVWRRQACKDLHRSYDGCTRSKFTGGACSTMGPLQILGEGLAPAPTVWSDVLTHVDGGIVGPFQ